MSNVLLEPRAVTCQGWYCLRDGCQMAAAAGMAEEQPPAWRWWQEDDVLCHAIWGLGRFGGFCSVLCNPGLFALLSSSDAVTWADPDRWKPLEDLGDPQGLVAGKSLEP